MKCPTCSTPLETEVVIGVTIDHCARCQGYWFDDGEMKKVIPAMAESGIGDDLEAATIHRAVKKALPNPQRRCPRCEQVMANFNYCYNSNILLDRCNDCRGIWMDEGELIRVVSYVQGNPMLDRLAAAMAQHAADKVAMKRQGEAFGNALTTTHTAAGVYALLIDYLLRWKN